MTSTATLLRPDHRETVTGALLLILVFAFYLLDYPALAMDYIARTSERTLEAFALARGINAVISVIQNAEIGFTLGVSATLSPGEILDPVNDLIERFSLVMLVASTLFWTLRLLGGLLFGATLLWGLVALFLAGYGLKRAGPAWLAASGDILLQGTNLFLGLLLYTIVTPLVVQLVHDTAPLQAEYQASSRQLNGAREQLERMNLEMENAVEGSSTPATDDCEGVGGCLEALTERIGRLTGYSTLGQRIDRYIGEATRVADQVSHDVVTQIAIFVLETLLIPMALLWLTGRMLARQLPG
ncbi:MAG TPA: hypothetical protein ENK50_01345 [Sedimenticola sp.]|nr:hypothetical protein [Sedimenticola sp.]